MISPDIKLDYSDVLLVPQWQANGPNSRADVTLLNADGHVPIIAANMDGVGTFAMAKELYKYNIITALHKHYSADELIEFFTHYPELIRTTIYSMGTTADDMYKFQCVFDAVMVEDPFPKVMVDVANGYTDATFNFISNLSRNYQVDIMAGNVVTPAGIAALSEAGAHTIKVGIGPGSVCTTRKLTGVGYPQLSAVLECAEYAKSLRSHPIQIIADGGITCPGDIAKALAAGADYVMIGGLFAGHDEGGANGVVTHAQTGVPFYGMASKRAQEIHSGELAEYRASEGKEVVVPYRGPVKNTALNMLGGLRSACSYLGVKSLSDISKNACFVHVNNQTNEMYR